VLSVLMERTELLTLEICCMLIPLLNGLLTSDQDRYLISADFQNFVAVYMAVNTELPCITSSSGRGHHGYFFCTKDFFLSLVQEEKLGFLF
jgi:hypothetical protein